MFEPADRLLVLSPHLDDGVMSCGRLLASVPGCTVATIFAGRPAPGQPLTDWDRSCGFAPGDDVIGVRREEDRAALYALGAVPVWLDFLDSQYGSTPDVESIVARLEEVASELAPTAVLLPIGLFHSDHQLTHRAGIAFAARHAELLCLAYEDALYRRIPEALPQRLAELSRAYLQPRRVPYPEAPRAERRKRDAVHCYRSQLIGLSTPGRLGHLDVYEPEGYWRLEPRASGESPDL
jgi:LmbE family N-acetylglucosaminyl deacetylase